MKKNLIFSLLMVFSAILINSCTKDDNTDPIGNDGTEEEIITKSVFRVEYEQSGDLEKFSIGFELGNHFMYTDTKEDAPVGFTDFKEHKYSFTNKIPVEEIDLGIRVGWIPIDTLVYQVEVNLTVYRDSVLLDEQRFVANSTNDNPNILEDFNYKAPGNE